MARLGIAYASNDDSHSLLSCAADNWGLNSKLGNTQLTPAQAMYRGKLWTAFVTDDGNVMITSSQDGSTWSSPVFTGQTTRAGVSLATFQGRLWMAYRGTAQGGNQVLVASTGEGTKWTFNTDTGQQSSTAVSLAVYENQLWIAFTSADVVGRLSFRLLVCSSSNGNNWSPAIDCLQTTQHSPSAAVLDGQLWIAFVADNGGNQLFFCGSPDGTSWTRTCYDSGQTTKSGPGLTNFSKQLYATFMANSDDNHIYVMSSPSGSGWSPQTYIGQQSPAGPAICSSEVISGTLHPKYHILALFYAPPGTNGGKSSSSAQYGSSSSAGTTNTIKSSFSDQTDVSISGDLFYGNGDVDFNLSVSNSDSDSIDIKVTKGNGLMVPGALSDGIDHDEDIFYLWLNPVISLDFDSNNAIIWSLDNSLETMVRQRVSVKELKDPDNAMDPGVKLQLDALGFTDVDYKTILAANPFSYGDVPIDVSRYSPAAQSYPYRRPTSPGAPVPVDSFTQSTSTTETSTKTTEYSYGVSFSASAGIGDAIKETIKDKLQWTNSSTQTSATGTALTASFAIGGPSYDYPASAPREIYVYFDSIFNSWLFSFDAPQKS